MAERLARAATKRRKGAPGQVADRALDAGRARASSRRSTRIPGRKDLARRSRRRSRPLPRRADRGRLAARGRADGPHLAGPLVVSKEGDHERATYNVKTGFRPDPTLVHPSLGAIVCHQTKRQRRDSRGTSRSCPASGPPAAVFSAISTTPSRRTIPAVRFPM